MLISLIGFAAVLIMAFLRVPIAFAMGLVGAVGFAWLNRWNWTASLSPAAGSVLDSLQTETLSVLPLFIFMGLIVSQTGLATELYKASNAFVGHRRGGLGMATILACGGFSAISGSSLATAATMAKVAMPEMRRFRYSDELAAATIAAGGTLGILIPPSVVLIIYGILTAQSIDKLFVAGVLPGLLGIALYLLAVMFIVWRAPEKGPAGVRTAWRGRLSALAQVWGILLLFMCIFGGIYFGLYTTTEAAGIGASGAVLLALLRGRLTLPGLRDALLDTITTTAALFMVLIGAVIFQRFIVRAGLPDALLDLIAAYSLGPTSVILAMILIYIVLGTVFESMSMLLLTVPIFAPVIVGLDLFSAYGAIGQEMSLIWFGIFVVVAIEISLITPPIGLNVYVLKGVLRDVPTATIFRGVTPFWCADIVRLLLLAMLPQIALYLPMTIRTF
ncbi:MAG: TRAP transporter large permease [Pararhodobacter sp.]|nr:TRAP transporter large permease [Pararhodobacter sp.]